MEYTVLIVLWISWCSIHSGMISPTFIGYLKKRLGRHYKYYRLFYNITSLLTLIPVVLYSRNSGPLLFRWEGYLMFVQFLFLASGIALFISGGLTYDMLHFLGVRQIRTGKSHMVSSESGEIDTSGILGITRHPWYLAAIILIWAGCREMYVSNVIVNMLLTVYLVIGTLLEERKLMIEFGDSYRNYRHRVSMLFPTKWVLSRLS